MRWLAILLAMPAVVLAQFTLRTHLPQNGSTGFGVADENVVGSWNGADGSARDWSQAFNNGAFSNGASVVSNAFSFNGSNGCIAVISTNGLKPPLPVSISAWVKPTTIANINPLIAGGIFASDFLDGGLTYNGYWVYIVNGGSLQANFGDGTTIGSTARRSKVGPLISSHVWTHICAVIRGTTNISLYVNGTDVGGTYSGTGGNTMVYSNRPPAIGVIDNNAGVAAASTFQGLINDVVVWNISLTTNQVGQLYQVGKLRH